MRHNKEVLPSPMLQVTIESSLRCHTATKTQKNAGARNSPNPRPCLLIRSWYLQQKLICWSRTEKAIALKIAPSSVLLLTKWRRMHQLQFIQDIQRKLTNYWDIVPILLLHTILIKVFLSTMNSQMGKGLLKPFSQIVIQPKLNMAPITYLPSKPPRIIIELFTQVWKKCYLQYISVEEKLKKLVHEIINHWHRLKYCNKIGIYVKLIS